MPRYLDEIRIDRAHASDGVHQDREHGAEKHDDDFRGEADPESDHQQRQDRDGRRGIERRHEGIEHGI
jgi:hypothetical protein